jgi:hypothetical protein
MLVAWEIFLLAVTLRLGAAGVLFVPRGGGRGQYICSFILAWLTGIGLALIVAAAIKPVVPHPGHGVEGENNYDSFAVINVGFWLAFLGAALGSWSSLGRQRSRRPTVRPKAASAARAPWLNNFRRYLLRRLVIPSRRGLLRVFDWRGTRPSLAASALSTAAIGAVAIMTRIPPWFSPAQDKNSASNATMRRSEIGQIETLVPFGEQLTTSSASR